MNNDNRQQALLPALVWCGPNDIDIFPVHHDTAWHHILGTGWGVDFFLFPSRRLCIILRKQPFSYASSPWNFLFFFSGFLSFWLPEASSFFCFLLTPDNLADTVPFSAWLGCVGSIGCGGFLNGPTGNVQIIRDCVTATCFGLCCMVGLGTTCRKLQTAAMVPCAFCAALTIMQPGICMMLNNKQWCLVPCMACM